MALTNRVLAFAKGFKECGHDCEVLILNPTEHNSDTKNLLTNSVFENIKFSYNANTTLVPRNPIKRGFTLSKSIISLPKFISKKIREKKYDVFFVFYSHPIFLYMILYSASRYKIKIIWQ